MYKFFVQGEMNGPRYILGSRIASGGMAEIHLGKQISQDGFERVCAIKRILPHLSSNKDFIDMFRDEAHICKKLQHTNIVRIEGFEDIEGSFAIVMEFVNGSDLRSVLSACEKSGTKLSVPMALFIATESARGLHYAHTKRDDVSQVLLNIVHRDISPQNILISYEGEVKVTDFGIANAKDKNTETQTGTVKGKYSYMSPEQILAQKVDHRSDIFSLGIVLWEMLAMRKLFQSRNDVSTIGRVRECKIPFSLAKEFKEIAPELEEIVLKALAKESDKRYQTAGDLEKALRKYQYTNYPDFTANDLGSFINERLISKRKQIQKDLKTMLTKTAPLQDRTRTRSAQGGQPLSGVGENPLLSIGQEGKPSLGGSLYEDHGSSAVSLSSLSNPDADYADDSRSGSIPPSLIPPPPSQLTSPSYIPKPISSSRDTVGSYDSPAMIYHSKRRRRRRRRKQRATNQLIFFLAIVMIVIIGVIYLLKEKSSLRVPAGEYLQLRLDTIPSTVVISVDGRKYQDGRYLQTPITLKSKPGKHLVKIQRRGYRSRKFEYQGRKGQTIEKTIVLNPTGRFSPVRVFSKNNKKYTIDVNNGFFRGKSPALIPDLAFNKTHIIKVYPAGKRTYFTCRFVPTSLSQNAPYQVIIRSNGCIAKPQ